MRVPLSSAVRIDRRRTAESWLLTMAGELARHGIRPRIIDRLKEPPITTPIQQKQAD
jgi:hypothetical protein